MDIENELEKEKGLISQLCGFTIAGETYGIPVLEVQEVIKALPTSPIPLSPEFVDGLINLRGQIVTAINVRKLFGIPEVEKPKYMNIIVKHEDSYYSLLVDKILDVMELKNSNFEETPDTLDPKRRGFIDGVYKMEKGLLILIKTEKILDF